MGFWSWDLKGSKPKSHAFTRPTPKVIFQNLNKPKNGFLHSPHVSFHMCYLQQICPGDVQKKMNRHSPNQSGKRSRSGSQKTRRISRTKDLPSTIITFSQKHEESFNSLSWSWLRSRLETYKLALPWMKRDWWALNTILYFCNLLRIAWSSCSWVRRA